MFRWLRRLLGWICGSRNPIRPNTPLSDEIAQIFIDSYHRVPLHNTSYQIAVVGVVPGPDGYVDCILLENAEPHYAVVMGCGRTERPVRFRIRGPISLQFKRVDHG